MAKAPLYEGEGPTYFNCQLIKHQSKRIVKITPKASNSNRSEEFINVFKEVYLMKSLVLLVFIKDHPNILKLIEFFDEPDRFCIVFENYVGLRFIEQARKFNQLPERVVANITKQILQTLNYLHQSQIVYRSLSTNSLFIDSENRIKLIDFSNAQHIDHEITSS